jgi:hypothetical protein
MTTDSQSPQQEAPPPPSDSTPRFGRLLLVCFAAVLFCGVLVWFVGNYLQDCCTFDFFTKLGR